MNKFLKPVKSSTELVVGNTYMRIMVSSVGEYWLEKVTITQAPRLVAESYDFKERVMVDVRHYSCNEENKEDKVYKHYYFTTDLLGLYDKDDGELHPNAYRMFYLNDDMWYNLFSAVNVFDFIETREGRKLTQKEKINFRSFWNEQKRFYNNLGKSS